MDTLPIRNSFAIAALGLLLLCLTGCASSGGTSKAGPVKKVMQAMGLANTVETSKVTVEQVPLQLFTGSNLNAGSGKKPLALVVKIYQLRSRDRFDQTPFDDFIDSSATQAALGNEMLNSREMLVLPGQHYANIESMPVETRYLGLVALFRSPAERRWRFVYDVKKSEATGITVGLHACAMSSTSGDLLTELPDPSGSLASVHCPKLSP